MTEGSALGFDVTDAVDSGIVEPLDEEVTAALLIMGVEDVAATLLATLAEAVVWKVDTWALEIGTASETFAAIGIGAIGKAAAGQRHEQSQGPEEAAEAAGAAAGITGELEAPRGILEPATLDAPDAAVST
ncbi:MAG: hypothetical protein Q9219_002009 [cf. Caloplaca sp. 3 TL-2023]